jgi:RNA polymerase sigma-70 factor (ECF subfamily)
VPKADNVSALLSDWRNGDPSAREELLRVVYDELRRLATHFLGKERPGHTLQPTALVHELYLRLFSAERVTWNNRAHFFAIAAQTLQRILIDHARMNHAERRGGGQLKVSLGHADGIAKPRDEDLLAIDEALQRLTELEPRAAQVVELRFFGGLQEHEVAEVLGVSPITVKRDWKVARAWLTAQLGPATPPKP